MPEITVRLATPSDAATIHRLTQLAFRDYRRLDPPSGTSRETEATVRDDLVRSGGAIARLGDVAVGCLRFESAPQFLLVRRLAVDPSWQRQGIGTALMNWSHDFARSLGLLEVRVGVRAQLSENLQFYRRLGYSTLAKHHHPGYRRVTWLELSRPL